MGLLEAVILGIIQGLTEFLPISSTAHLTVAENLLFGESMPLSFDVLLHVGTLAALAIYFRREISMLVLGVLGRDPAGLKLARLLFLAMIPTGVLALATRPLKEAAKGHLWLYGVFLAITAAMLWVANLLAQKKQGRDLCEINALDAICIGSIQGLGGGFGLSRSGSTIAVGVFRGLGLHHSTRFSFLLGIPTISAAAMVEGRHGVKSLLQGPPPFEIQSVHAHPLTCIVGICAAAVSGYFAIGLLDRFTRRPRLGGFALYCLVAGATVVLLGVVLE